MLLYTSLFDFHFFARNVGVIGGLLVLAGADDPTKQRRSLTMMDTIKGKDDKQKYLLLAGRVLTGFLPLTIVLKERAYMNSVIFAMLAIATCGLGALVATGFNPHSGADEAADHETTQAAAVGLAVLMLLETMYAHIGWITLDHGHWEKDLHRYYFFQLLSVVGGILLVASRGPGSINLSAKKL